MTGRNRVFSQASCTAFDPIEGTETFAPEYVQTDGTVWLHSLRPDRGY
ncbi:protein of unknown function [Candidatus Promineifilum breve]|uniref:Uncharacterized protein n=1 Tax=Candidatus Promineifilum breve TaxID=1806508 RepID=A0A160T589_9CHLR|nr:protein of unknown function [Candidatus Promineifilum breve]